MATGLIGDIMSILSGIGSGLTTAQQQQLQNQVYGQQQNALAFMQNPNQMNQFLGALTAPYSYAANATPQLAAQTQQYLQGLQDPYANVANQGTAAQNQAYLQAQQTPYTTALAAQNPNQMNSLINQYTQGLNSGLTSGVWNNVQDQLAASGMAQAPGVAAYNYSQALAPYYQQNQQLAAQLAQQPVQYGLAEQQYGLQAGQLPLQWQQAQQGYGLAAGALPLNYGLQATQLGLNEATNALNYPLNIGSGLAGMFPNYNFSLTGP